jgi:hypothetical protein
MKGFAATTAGGAMNLTDAGVDAMLAATAGGFTCAAHPRNSHRYNLVDDNQLVPITGYTNAQRDLNLTTIANRRARILAADSAATSIATVTGVAGSTPQIDLFNAAADARIGLKIVDELWVEGYPNKTPSYLTGRIAGCAAAADATGKPYMGVLQVFSDIPGNFVWPTQPIFDQMLSEWLNTNVQGFVIYVWNNADPTNNLSTDSSMQSHIGAKMAALP